MISIKKDLIGSTHKTIITGNLVDFKENRENIGVSVCRKFAFKTTSSVFF